MFILLIPLTLENNFHIDFRLLQEILHTADLGWAQQTQTSKRVLLNVTFIGLCFFCSAARVYVSSLGIFLYEYRFDQMYFHVFKVESVSFNMHTNPYIYIYILQICLSLYMWLYVCMIVCPYIRACTCICLSLYVYIIIIIIK